MGFNKISELDPAALVNDSDLFAGVQEENNTLDNKKYTAEQLKLYFQDGTQSELTFDDVPVENSNNPVKSGGLYSEFAAKQDTLTFDVMPIDGSSNPVTSDGIEAAIASSEARSIPLSQKGEAGGVAELDSSGKVLSSQLPSYVDDVEEYLSRSSFPVFGEGGKIYIALDTNKMYRWSGTQYTEVSESLALGETSSTAYRGDRGKTAYDFSQAPYASTPAMDGAASAGSSNSWARGDHVHPKDTSKQDVLTFDNIPTENSANPVKSGGVYSALSSKQDTLTFDNIPTENSDNPVKSGGVYSSLATKQDTLTFDNVPTDGSTNPVKSGGIYDAILKLYPTDTASGPIASFPDGADDMPVVDLKVSIQPVQEGSGDPSPENVRPISGWTGAGIYSLHLPEGYAACDYVRINSQITIPISSDITSALTSTDTLISVNFRPVGYKQYGFIYSWYLSEEAAATRIIMASSLTHYYLNFNRKANTVQIINLSDDGFHTVVNAFDYYSVDGVTTSVSPNVGTGNTSTRLHIGSPNASFDLRHLTLRYKSEFGGGHLMCLCPCVNPSGVAGLYDLVANTFYTTSNPTYVTAYGDLQKSSEKYSYLQTISWATEAGTVYGGTLDVTTGLLTVTRGQIASYAGETLPGTWISDRDVYAAGTSPSTGAQVVYELAEPITYQLTPTQVRTLLGANNIWADTGDVTAEYRADTKLYIEKKLSELSED